MTKKKLQKGMKVRTTVWNMAYYDAAEIPEGSIGIIGAVDCPFVNKPGYFQCVDFEIEGQVVRGAYKKEQLKIIE